MRLRLSFLPRVWRVGDGPSSLLNQIGSPQNPTSQTLVSPMFCRLGNRCSENPAPIPMPPPPQDGVWKSHPLAPIQCLDLRTTTWFLGTRELLGCSLPNL